MKIRTKQWHACLMYKAISISNMKPAHVSLQIPWFLLVNIEKLKHATVSKSSAVNIICLSVITFYSIMCFPLQPVEFQLILFFLLSFWNMLLCGYFQFLLFKISKNNKSPYSLSSIKSKSLFSWLKLMISNF